MINVNDFGKLKSFGVDQQTSNANRRTRKYLENVGGVLMTGGLLAGLIIATWKAANTFIHGGNERNNNNRRQRH